MEATSNASCSLSDLEIEAVNPVTDLITFSEMQDIYEPHTTIFVPYCLGEKVTSQRRDWIGIFRTGWKSLWQYHAFQWASHHPINCRHPAERVVVFPQSTFQENAQQAKDRFQFLYITKDDHVIGVSSTFQIGYRDSLEYPICKHPEKISMIDDVDDLHLEWLEQSLKGTNVEDKPNSETNRESLRKLSDNFEFLPHDEESTKLFEDVFSQDNDKVVQEDHDSLAKDFTYTSFLERLSFLACNVATKDTESNKERSVVPYMPIYDVNKFERPATLTTRKQEPGQNENLGYLLLYTPELEYPQRLAIEGPSYAEVSLVPIRAVTQSYCPGCVISQTIAAEFMKRHSKAMDRVSVLETENLHLKTIIKSKDIDLDEAMRTIREHLTREQNKEEKRMKQIQKIKEKRKTKRILSLKVNTHNMDQKIKYLEKRLDVTEAEKSKVLHKLTDLSRSMEEKQKSHGVVQRQLCDVIAILNDLGYKTSMQTEGDSVSKNDETSTMIENTRWKLKMKKQTERIQGKLRDQEQLIESLEEQLKIKVELLDFYKKQPSQSLGSSSIHNKKLSKESQTEVREEQWPSVQYSHPRLRKRLEKCPKCAVEFSANTDIRLIEEHIAFHDTYDK